MSQLNYTELSKLNDTRINSTILNDTLTWIYKMNYSWVNDTRPVDHEKGVYTPFYVAITICSVIGGLLFILNIVCCWCSSHRHYWLDRHTGNRWIQSMWVVTPHKNPPLDLSELKSRAAVVQVQYPDPNLYYPSLEVQDEDVRYPERELGSLQQQEYMTIFRSPENMAMHVFWPASACLTLFVVGVIMIILQWAQIRESMHKVATRLGCGSRRNNYQNNPGEGCYDLEVSESIA